MYAAPPPHRHLQQLGCEVTLLATDWFLCLFITTLPVEVALRVWDALFCEGGKVGPEPSEPSKPAGTCLGTRMLSRPAHPSALSLYSDLVPCGAGAAQAA
jgi:hypothetical protein